MKRIRLGAFGLCLILLLSSLCMLAVTADDAVIEGTCGDNARWMLNTVTGEMTIKGEGSITDYSPLQTPPWLSKCNLITSVTIQEGITSLGAYTFLYCSNLARVSLPDSLKSVAAYAFYNCRSLKSVTLPEGVTTLGNKVFSGCTALTTVSLPSTLTSVGDGVFSAPPSDKILYNGDAQAWSAVTVGAENDILTEALVLHPGHRYDQEITDAAYLVSEATCTESAIYRKSCVCGEADTETFALGEPIGHKATPATCTEDEICSVCHELLTPKFGHSYEELALPPTCTEDGLFAYTCARCGDHYTRVEDALGHTAGSEATCTRDQVCTVCDTILTPMLGHDYTHTVTEPTCTEQGYTVHTCGNCFAAYRDAFVPANGHTDGPEATCTEDQTCTDCGAVLTKKTGHSYKDSVTEPTCDAQGYTEHVCESCGTAYRDAFTPAKGHTGGPEATCTDAQTCTVCSTVLAEKTGHSYKDSVTEPTCDAQGYTDHICESCGTAYRDTVTPAKGHTGGPEATCTDAQTCTTCGTVVTPPLGHDQKDTVVPPACTLQGYTQHTCARCHFTYRDTVTPATGHVAGDAATCTDAQTCTSCGEILAQKLGHDYRSAVVEATCATAGYTSHECALCHVAYRDSYTTASGHTPGEAATCEAPQTCTVCHVIITPAAGHAYEDTVTPPTCTEAGYTTHACSVCHIAYVDEITETSGHTAGPEATCHAPQTCTACNTLLAERLEHSYEESVVDPTCEEDGHTAKTCTLCGQTLLSDYTPATGHTAGDWVVVREPDVGVSGRKHKACNTCGEVMETETFWPTQETTPTEPDGTSDSTTTETVEEEKEGGCKLTGGNIAVIVIILLAAFLLWFVDLTRR